MAPRVAGRPDPGATSCIQTAKQAGDQIQGSKIAKLPHKNIYNILHLEVILVPHMDAVNDCDA